MTSRPSDGLLPGRTATRAGALGVAAGMLGLTAEATVVGFASGAGQVLLARGHGPRPTAGRAGWPAR